MIGLDFTRFDMMGPAAEIEHHILEIEPSLANLATLVLFAHGHFKWFPYS